MAVAFRHQGLSVLVTHCVEEGGLASQHAHVYGAGFKGNCLRVCHRLELQVLHRISPCPCCLVKLLQVLCIKHLRKDQGLL